MYDSMAKLMDLEICKQKSRPGREFPTGFFYVSPAGRAHLRVKVSYESGRGNR